MCHGKAQQALLYIQPIFCLHLAAKLNVLMLPTYIQHLYVWSKIDQFFPCEVVQFNINYTNHPSPANSFQSSALKLIECWSVTPSIKSASFVQIYLVYFPHLRFVCIHQHYVPWQSSTSTVEVWPVCTVCCTLSQKLFVQFDVQFIVQFLQYV